MFASLVSSRRRKVAAGVAAVAVLVGGGAFIVAQAGDEETTGPPTTTTAPPTTTTAPTTTTTVPVPVAPLTGMTGRFGDRLSYPAVFVKIDNAPEARPHAGLVQADIVFEERVEGNTTRFAAVFHSTNAPRIGPVRSTRSTDFSLTPLFGRPIYASSGGNGNIISSLHRTNVVDVGHNVSGRGFDRVPGRRAPHNLFTRLMFLYQKSPEKPPPPKPVFQYRPEGGKLPMGARPAKEVVLSFGAAPISRFVWDPPSRQWHRYHGSARHLDISGKPIAPRNVVTLEIPYEFNPSTGNSMPHGTLAGEGRLLVLTAGHAIGGKWVRPTPKSPLELLDNNGNQILLTPGQTWVELVPPGGFTWR